MTLCIACYRDLSLKMKGAEHVNVTSRPSPAFTHVILQSCTSDVGQIWKENQLMVIRGSGVVRCSVATGNH